MKEKICKVTSKTGIRVLTKVFPEYFAKEPLASADRYKDHDIILGGVTIARRALRRKLCGYKISKEELMTNKYDHTLLSKMYSKSEVRPIFAKFKDLEISIITFGGIKENRKLW